MEENNNVTPEETAETSKEETTEASKSAFDAPTSTVDTANKEKYY